MPIHSLLPGRTLIDALAKLGDALGYVVEQELPVEQGRANPPAVDVAWLGEKGQVYPLMIFEVESRVTNAAANNAVKVFGQPNERFERPLFFFHVFISGGADTSRIETLRRSYGLHNYRVYRLDQDDSTRLVQDVLSQHRRLHRTLDLPALLEVLNWSGWEGVDLDSVLNHAEALRFDGNFLAVYAEVGVKNPFFRERFFRLLLSFMNDPPVTESSYEYGSYLGRLWAEPIHIGLLSLRYPSEGEWLERLRHWQERTSYLTMIGPHFGLAQDYDDFVLGTAPVLWALIAALMHDVDGADSYIIDQYRTVLNAVSERSPAVSFFTAIWMLHAAVAADDVLHYEFARTYINERGGIGGDILFEPPSLVSIIERDDRWVRALMEQPDLVPDIDVFRRELPRRYERTENPVEDLITLTLRLLSDGRAIYEWSASVALLLHATRA
jgi:hypothetical protein